MLTKKRGLLKTSQRKKNLFLCIPARLLSTRLPQKPLAMVQGKPLVVRVAERALLLKEILKKSSFFTNKISNIYVLIATDSTKVINAFSADSKNNELLTILTPAELNSGTDRVYSALNKLEFKVHPNDIVINIQGDEPLFPIEPLVEMSQTLVQNPKIHMATIAYRNSNFNEYLSSSCVKVLINKIQNAIYFSRAPIPWNRKTLGASGSIFESLEGAESSISKNSIPSNFYFFQHIGIYGFTFHSLKQFVKNIPKSELENTEGLEQLRAIEAGWSIFVLESLQKSFGIDTPEDLKLAQDFFNTENLSPQ
jgi:3-deoxy-manno-octulosonate cytidylyltransferase (CMP-KDO synthetase)